MKQTLKLQRGDEKKHSVIYLSTNPDHKMSVYVPKSLLGPAPWPKELTMTLEGTTS